MNEPGWNLAKQDADELLSRLKKTFAPLGKYAQGKICMGIKSGLTDAFVIDEDIRTVLLKKDPKAKEIIKPLLNGRDIRRYQLEWKKNYLIYTHHGVEMKKYPEIERFLKPFKRSLEKRATRQKWYELQQPQSNFVEYLERSKIIFPDIATTPRFALDDRGYYGSNTTYFIAMRDLYLLALLNSQLGKFYFVLTCAGLEGKNETYLRFFGQYLEGFPVRTINFSDPVDKSRHDHIVSLVEQMLAAKEKLAAAKSDADVNRLEMQCESLDRQIDDAVYGLYGLTEEERKIVEGE